MKLSIIVPYRQRPSSIKLLVKCFNEQQRVGKSDYEILIVNLGSEHIVNLPDIAKEIYINYKGIFSRGYCCNVGAKESNADLIWFVDADCIPHPYLISLLFQKFNFNRPEFAINAPVIFLNETETRRIYQQNKYTFEEYKKYKANNGYRVKPKIDGTSQICMFRKKFIEIGGIDQRFIGHGYEDMNLHDRIATYVDFWDKWPTKSELPFSIKNELVLTHLWHGRRDYRSKYMANYSKNLRMYRSLKANPGIIANRGVDWGNKNLPPGNRHHSQ